MDQIDRNKVITAFKRQESSILVATDVAGMFLIHIYLVSLYFSTSKCTVLTHGGPSWSPRPEFKISNRTVIFLVTINYYLLLPSFNNDVLLVTPSTRGLTNDLVQYNLLKVFCEGLLEFCKSFIFVLVTD